MVFVAARYFQAPLALAEEFEYLVTDVFEKLPCAALKLPPWAEVILLFLTETL